MEPNSRLLVLKSRLVAWLVMFVTVVIAPSFAMADTGIKLTGLAITSSANEKIRISSESPLTVTFPSAMASGSEFDVVAKTAPIRLKPELSGTFMWKSPTEGTFKSERVPPGTRFEVFLNDGVKDLSGKALPAGEKVGEVESDPFTADIYNSPENALKKRPSISVRFSHPVNPADVAAATWFQDRESRQRIPADVILQEDEDAKVTYATVTPQSDLPGSRTYDLLIEGIVDAATNTRSKQLFMAPLGQTAALHVEKIAAFNYPMQKRRIAVEFSKPVDLAEAQKIKVEPPVENLQPRIAWNAVWLEGDFDITKRYRVTVPQSVTGKNGFPMASESKWWATFQPKKPALIFPSEDLHQRSRLGLNFAFMQVNTGPLQWRLARVTPEKLLAITTRAREFEEKQFHPVTSEALVDPDTGWPIWTKTELLIDASHLEVVATGAVEASDSEADTLRKIQWKPANAIPSGTYVLEITGKNAEGKVIGNRAIISFTEYTATQKQYGDTVLLHISNIADGSSVPSVKVRALTAKNEFLAETQSDRDGFATFPKKKLIPGQGAAPAEWFILETQDGPMLQRAQPDRYFNSGYVGGSEGRTPPPAYRLTVSADRPLYRPGEPLHFKVMAREVGREGQLRIPRNKEVTWRLVDDADSEIASGQGKLDDYGGFDAGTQIPATARLGAYEVSATIADVTQTDQINVQEFRPPPFTVAIEDLKLTGAQAGIRVSSAYFHGAANSSAKVKWTADWTPVVTGDPNIIVTDVPRLVTAPRSGAVKTTGEGELDPYGTLLIKVAPPAEKGPTRGSYRVSWSVAVTALDAQTISEVSDTQFYVVPVDLQVSASQIADPNPAHPLAIAIKGEAFDPEKKPIQNQSLSIELYKVSTKTVKEQIAPRVYRFRNSTSFAKRETFAGPAPIAQTVPVPGPGEYLVTARDPANSKVPVATYRVYVAGQGDSEFPIQDEDSIGVTHDRQGLSDDDAKEFVVGEKAFLSVQAPFGGIAWVSVEAEDVIDTLVLPLKDNSGRLEIPIKPEYAPNAWATVYLLAPGGNDRLPAERFGAVQLSVRRPDREVKVTPVLFTKQIRPKEMVAGLFEVSSEGRPLKDADLTIYAVNEAILDAGDWHEPALRGTMYPRREWRVSTYRGLEKMSLSVDASSLHQKGFIIGAGEFKAVMAEPEFELRTNFPPLAFWKTGLRSDKDGKVPFSFPAPDALTKYRVIALAQTKDSRFGTGSDLVEISKPIQIEPALPRFLRATDEVELRAIVRQKIQDKLPVTVRCDTTLTLKGSNSQTQDVRRDAPAVFRFAAKVGELANATIRFTTDAGSGDAVEITLPVHSPALLRKQTVVGPLSEVNAKIPQDWSAATGEAAMTISTSPWLPKLSGVPYLLDYPHGCMEQVTSRILAYSALADLLAYIPQSDERTQALRKRNEAGIRLMMDCLTDDNYLSYWPHGESAVLPTIAGFWAALSAKAQGTGVPQQLLESLGETVASIATDKATIPVQPFDRAFACMVLAQWTDAAELQAPVQEMYLRREKFDDETRALLAIAMHRLKILSVEKQQLLREIDRPVKERAFDPETFSSTIRVDAIRALAFATVDPSGKTGKSMEQLQQKISAWMDSSQSLSTQENLWLLFAFNAMHPPAVGKPANLRTANPAPAAISRNGASALWSPLEVRKVRDFALRLDHPENLTCQIAAQYRSDSPVNDRDDRGFRIERVVKNLTKPERMGTPEAPFKLGDQILITYRLISPKLHHYVAIDSELPAGLETVNPHIDSIARTYQLPKEEGSTRLDLSYSELRDQTTCLYFDRVAPGVGTYSVLARATSAGVFHWPGAQATPMYDNRFSGFSPSSLCSVVAE